MSNDGSDSGDTGGITNVRPLPLLDDTLNRKPPSMTFEKYIKQTNKGMAESAIETASYSENSKDHEFTETYELNLDGGSPVLNKFRNPFEDTPKDKNDKNKNLDPDIKNDPESSTLFKAPSKKEKTIRKNTPASLNRSKVLNISQASSINAAEEFRALKNKQVRDAGFDFDNFDQSNIGLVIDIRKNESENGEETSLDDSSIQLNLIPTTGRFNRREETQDTVEQTQADGNLHEEVNKMIKCQISNRHNEDEDGNYLLKGFGNSQENRYSSNDIVVEGDVGNETTSSEEKLHLSSAEKEEEKLIKDTLDVNISPPKNTDELSNPGTTEVSSDTLPKTPEKRDKSTQDLPNILDNNIYPNYRVSDQAQDNSKFSINFNRDKEVLLKETQVIDNFSQSIVIDEDEDEEKEEKVVSKKQKQAADDEDGEQIRTGRNILNTFRIEEESQSQSQSQFELQSESSNRDTDHAAQENDADQIQIQGSQANSSFGMAATQILTLPETLKIEEGNFSPSAEAGAEVGAQLSHISSEPGIEIDVDVSKVEHENENEITDPEIPNTSAMSISKICLEVKDNIKQNKIQDISEATSTPIIKSNKVYDVHNQKGNSEFLDRSRRLSVPSGRSNMMEKLSNALREEDQNVGELAHAKAYLIEREKKKKKYDITDVLDCNCVFIMDSSSRIPGRITKVVQSDDVILVNVKIKGGEVIVDHSKIYAPVCFCVGDAVKYSMDKRHNYIVTGLKKVDFVKEVDEPNSEGDVDATVETIDGYNRILIKKNLRNSKEKFEEIEVNLEDLYLTAPISRNYKYKLFNDPDDFQKYIDYQLSRSAMLDNDKSNDLAGVGADDTLINLLPVSRNRSFVKSRNQGYFSNCLFVITGLNSIRNGSRGDSKSNTPRHQKEKNDIHHLVDFIRLQGGTVLQDSGFEEIIKFRLKEKKKAKVGNIGYGINTSPRKAKKTGGEANGNDAKKGEKEFKNYKCLVDNDGYYAAEFRDGNNVEIDEEAAKFMFGCVISTRHVRTLKYLQCLCLKWPIIHTEFIKDCMKNSRILKNWENEWTRYLLIAGECSFLNSSIGLDVFGFYSNWKKGYRLSQQAQLNRLFEGSTIVIVADSFATFDRKLGDGKVIRRKRRKMGRGRQHDVNRDDVQSEREEEGREADAKVVSEDDLEDSDASSKCGSMSEEEGPRKVIDGPADEETLLWIFRQLGFDRAILPKEGCNLMSLLKLDHGDGKDDDRGEKPREYIYFKYGNDIERFRSRLERNHRVPTFNSMVNWEWVVQRIICNVL